MAMQRSTAVRSDRPAHDVLPSTARASRAIEHRSTRDHPRQFAPYRTCRTIGSAHGDGAMLDTEHRTSPHRSPHPPMSTAPPPVSGWSGRHSGGIHAPPDPDITADPSGDARATI